MVKRLLVTSADERTWPKNKNQPVLFLGEWCILYERKHIWDKLDYEVVPYHWHNKASFTNDYFYLQTVYENILINLRAHLNEIHRVNHSVNYWRILIGPWLGYFLQMLFDRWKMLKISIEKYNIIELNIIERESYSMVPRSMSEFDLMFTEDNWNEMIYGYLAENFFGDKLKINKIKLKPQDYEKNVEKARDFTLAIKENIKSSMLSLIDYINKATSKNDKFFFVSSYLPIATELKIQFALKQIPKRWRAEEIPSNMNAIDKSLRKNSKLKIFSSDNFINIAAGMLFKHIPSVYLEEYSKLNDKLVKSSWPNSPKVIFTSNAYHGSDYFKAWAAMRVEQGSFLVIGQHGGLFGMSPFGFEEEHQLKISDFWFSWGWTNSNNKIKPVANLKQLNSKLTHNPKGGALLVTFVTPRYSYHMYSGIVPSHWPLYFNDQCKFISFLPPMIQNEMTVRLYKNDRGWGQESRWNDKFPDIKLDHAEQPMKSMVKKCRVFIATYNATTYLETLAWNVPTIAFWNPSSWDLIDEVQDDFNLLKKVKILHDSPESAAQHLTEIWENIPEWWFSKEVQQAREIFCKRWSYVGEDSFSKFSSALREIASLT